MAMEPRSAEFDAEISRVKAAVNISAVVSSTLKLTRRGREFVACCPFHSEKTPSFTVNDERGFYHCFGCGSHGDVFDWLKSQHGMTLLEAVEHLGGAAPAPQAKPKAKEPEWRPLVPPPTDAPRPDLTGFDAIYTYADTDGSPLFYVRRRNAVGDKKKTFVPLTYGTLNGKRGWFARHPDAPRPLYGLDRLAAKPDARVIVCEGEKAADAAQRMLPNYACVSWPAGTANVKNADWSALAGRYVFVWPDNDAPGLKAAAEVAACEPGTLILRVDDLPDKADAADLDIEDPEGWIEARITEAQRKKKANGHDPAPPPEIEDPRRPTIRVINGLRHHAADQGLAAMVHAGVPFYQRDRTLVRAAIVKAKAADGRIIEVPGVVQVTGPILARALGQAAEWERAKKDGEPIRIDPPKEVVEQIGAMVGDWPFPPLAGVISTPTLRPDGSILSKPGYDEATGLVLLSPPPMPPVQSSPSFRDAERALTLLANLLTEFPFADDASRSVAISMILTVVLRGALLPAVPMHVVTAPQPGTGKSYLLDTAAVIATGERCPVIAMAPDPAETEKRLVGAALAGFPIIALDNVSDTLTGDFLAQATERPILQVRPLGSSNIIRIANTFSVFANGNNIVATADLVRRTLRCGLDSNLENPEERIFDRDPVATVLENRGAYIHACLTIARAFLSDPRARCCPRLPSFPAWSDLVRSPIVWLNWPDPIASMDVARGEDPTRQSRAALFAAWADELKPAYDGLLTSELVTHAQEMGERGPIYPMFRDACLSVARDRTGYNVSAERLGKWLRSAKNTRVGDMKLTVNMADKKRPRWQLMHDQDRKEDLGGLGG